MTISSSLNAGVAGLSANSSRLASISDNIANSSTYGYKRVQTDFQSMVLGNRGGTYSAGGVRSVTQRQVDARGGLTSTDNPTDLAVEGRGMLPVTTVSALDADGAVELRLTSTGSFRTDSQGRLTTEGGLALLGWPADPDGTIPNFPRDTPAGLEPVQINVNQLTGEPTTSMRLRLNLPADATSSDGDGEGEQLGIEYYDNLGVPEQIDVTFQPTIPAEGESNEWRMVLRDSASGDTVVGEYLLTFDASRELGGTLASVTTISGGAFDTATGTMTVDVADGPVEIDIGVPGDGAGLTQLTDRFAPISITKDGMPVGNMTSVAIDARGYVNALFDTGITRTIFQVPLIDMPNLNGMVARDQQTFVPSPESGTFFLWEPGEGPTGDIVSYAREESSTDVAAELTTMIRTQRAYSSNAKVIQTVDEMLQETTNLKR